MKRQYQHKKRDASDAMRESNEARKKAGTARKSSRAAVSRQVGDGAVSLVGFTPGEIESLSGLVTSAMSSLCAVRTILERRPVKRRQSE